MCRHEIIAHACGHKEDTGFFCDQAQHYGPHFNKVGCSDYTIGPERQYSTQCGKQRGFYCAQTQDGVIIDKVKEAMDTSVAQFSLKKSELQQIVLACSNYHQEAQARGIPVENLQNVPGYRALTEQRSEVVNSCTITRNRVFYLNTILNHAWTNHAQLAPGVGDHTVWTRRTFDLANTIFPINMLQPIRHLLPGWGPNPTLPTKLPQMNATGQHQRSQMNALGQHPELQMNTPGQHPGSLQTSNPNQYQGPLPTDAQETTTAADSGMQPPKQAKRPKLSLSTTPLKQKNVPEQESSAIRGIIRGYTPEGETFMEKCVRYKGQLTVEHNKNVAEAMANAGYDVVTNGVRPAPKKGHRRQAQPKPTPPKKNESQAATSNVRRSKRTLNNKPKYVEGSDNSSVLEDVSPDQSDAAWVETPSKSEASSPPTRPIRGSVGRNNRVTATGSPNSSPTQNQFSLSSTIFDYQKRTGNATFSGSPQMGGPAPPFGNLFKAKMGESQAVAQTPRTDTPQLSHNSDMFNGSDSTNAGGQQPRASAGSHSMNPYAQEMSRISHTPQQRTASMQRGAQLVQQLGRDLVQKQSASGVASAGAANLSDSQQHAMSPSTMYAPQAIMQPHALSATSHTLPPQSSSQTHIGSPVSPANIFHRKLQQSMTARNAQATPTLGHRSFPTGSVPALMLPMQQVQSSPTAPPSSGFQPSHTTHNEYENMRRSFSSTTNLTPHSSLAAQYNTPNTEPVKRSMPPASPTVTRKRARLSLPGEDDAPTLTPSSSSLQFYAPAGLPVNDHVDYTAGIAAIEEFEKQNMADRAALDAAPHHVDPELPQHIPVDPQLYEGTTSFPNNQIIENSFADHGSQIDGQTYTALPGENGTATENLPTPANEASDSSLSEPDWSILNDDAFF